MDQDNVLMENELERNDMSAIDLSASSTNCRTPTPELDTNFVAWRNPIISIDEDDSVGPPSPNQSEFYESPEQVKDSLEKDLEFIKRYALDAESDVLYSLLSSEVDNPNRLEFVMRDMLGLPDVPRLIAEYKKFNYKAGDKRSSDSLVDTSNDVKKRKVTISESVLNADVLNENEPQPSSSRESGSKTNESSNFEQNTAQNGLSSNLQKRNDQSSIKCPENKDSEEPVAEGGAKNEFLDSLKEMFPDADGLFLISESQHIKNWDECSRFINTVMLSGLYPKKGAKDDSWKRITSDSDDDVSEIPNSRVYRPTFENRSDEETVGSIDADDEELVVLSKKIVKINDKPMKNDEPKEISLIDLSNDKTEQDTIPKNKEQIAENTVDSLLSEETMMTVSFDDSDDSNATETYEADLPVLAASNFDQIMADELDLLLSDLNKPAVAPQPVPSVASTSVISTEARSQKTKKAPALEISDFEMEVVSSTSNEIRNAENDELDSILQTPGPCHTVSKMRKNPPFLKAESSRGVASTTLVVNNLSLPNPGTSQIVPKVIKIKEKPKEIDFVAEGQKIVEQAKQIVETAKSLIQKEISPTEVRLPLDMPKETLKPKKLILTPPTSRKDDAAVDEDEPNVIESNTLFAQPSTSKVITISSASSSSSATQKIETAKPGPSGTSTSRPEIEPAKSLPGTTNDEVIETTTNKPEAQKSVEEEKAAKESKWIEEQSANLVRIFPNSDPTFLKEECAKMGCSDTALNEFVVAKLENNDMPTRAEYEKRIEMEELQNRYTKNFVIQDFLKAIPDPWTYFSDSKRNSSKYKQHSLCYLKSSFRKHLMKDITDALNKNNYNLYLANKQLKRHTTKLRSGKRTDFECSNSRPTTIDIQFLQEVAFIENEDKIKDYLEAQKKEKERKFEEARRTNSLLECQCCFDNEVLVEDTVYCPNDHNFCKSCVIRSVEVEMGNARNQFNCLASCDSQFTLSSLQSVLRPEVFSKVIQAIQMEEIRAAGLEDLVQCPFCNYATILPAEEKIMTCLNPECLKESCRLCKELNHIPLRCEEVEKSEDIKLRTYIENKMTEALVRTCYKCNKKFVKEDGCNKMTCTCGARMCYVCRQPVTDYSHFNGQGGTDFSKCPLYSTNDELHVDVVKKVAEEAKQEVLKANPEKKLVHDPTMILPERRNDPLMPGMVRPGDVVRLPGVNVIGNPGGVNAINLGGRHQQQFVPPPLHLPPVQLPIPGRQRAYVPPVFPRDFRDDIIPMNAELNRPLPAHRNAARPVTPPPQAIHPPGFGLAARVAHGLHRRQRHQHYDINGHRGAPHHHQHNRQ